MSAAQSSLVLDQSFQVLENESFKVPSAFHESHESLQNQVKMRFRNLLPQRRVYNVMMSGDSPPPMQTSISPGFDMPDEMRPGKITPTNSPVVPLKPHKSNGEVPNEDIEEAVPIVKTLPMPEPQPKIERNGFDYDHTDGKQLVDDVEEDACFVKCVYFTQQCCECSIL